MWKCSDCNREMPCPTCLRIATLEKRVLKCQEAIVRMDEWRKLYGQVPVKINRGEK